MKSFSTFLSEEKKESLKPVVKKHIKTFSVSSEVNEIAIPMHMQFQQLIDNDLFSPYLEEHQKSKIHGDAMKFHELGHKYEHIAGFIKKSIHTMAHENEGEF